MNGYIGWAVLMVSDNERAEGEGDCEQWVSPEGLMSYDTTVIARNYYEGFDIITRTVRVA